MKKLSKKRIIIISALFVLIILSAAFFIQAGNILVINDTPEKCDAVVVLSGDHSGDRTAHGVKLFKEGYGDYLILSGGRLYYKTTIASLMKDHAIGLGVPEKNILIEDQARNTVENSTLVKGIMLEKNLKSALVVTSDYHTRRSKMIFDKTFKGSGIKVVISAAVDSDYNPKAWWSDKSGLSKTFNEYIKLVYYRITL